MRRLVIGAVIAACACTAVPAHRTDTLRVCADPNNLPFSNRGGEGFENRIAVLLATDRGAELHYTWWAQRRGFIRNTLQARACDVIIGVPTDLALARTTRRYYRSSYVFLSRRDRELHLTSLDDSRLPHLRVGVQMIGDDFANSPPAHALARRGMHNVIGYPVYGDYAQPSPLSPIVAAVDGGTVDAAIVWGPAAGYFAQHAVHPLEVTPISPRTDTAALPFVFNISMAVRREDRQLVAEIDDFIDRRRPEIDAILAEYGVPRVEGD